MTDYSSSPSNAQRNANPPDPALLALIQSLHNPSPEDVGPEQGNNTTVQGTPIVWKSNMPGLMGRTEFGDDTLAGKIASTILHPYYKMKGQPDPNQTKILMNTQFLPQQHDTITHEMVHAALEPVEGRLPELNKAAAHYNDIRQVWPVSQELGDTQTELPAYANEPASNTNRPDVPQQFLDQYKQSIVRQLLKIDPKIATKVKRLYGMQGISSPTPPIMWGPALTPSK